MNNHVWQKKNLSTLMDSKSSYDLFQCVNCGKKIRKRGLFRDLPKSGCKGKV